MAWNAATRAVSRELLGKALALASGLMSIWDAGVDFEAEPVMGRALLGMQLWAGALAAIRRHVLERAIEAMMPMRDWGRYVCSAREESWYWRRRRNGHRCSCGLVTSAARLQPYRVV